LNISPQVWDPYTSENIYSLEKSKDEKNVMYATDNTAPVMSQTLCPQLANSAIQERRIKASLQMFHKIVNNKIEIPYENIT
jgi:hypothetical protein